MSYNKYPWKDRNGNAYKWDFPQELDGDFSQKKRKKKHHLFCENRWMKSVFVFCENIRIYLFFGEAVVFKLTRRFAPFMVFINNIFSRGFHDYNIFTMRHKPQNITRASGRLSCSCLRQIAIWWEVTDSRCRFVVCAILRYTGIAIVEKV